MSSPPTPTPTTEYCFHIPSLPYVRKVPQYPSKHPSSPSTKPSNPENPVICYTPAQLSEEHLQKVKDICAVYAKCDYMVCKNYLGHAVMCPDENHYQSSCLYSWAKQGLGTPAEQAFIKNGSHFISPNQMPQTVEQCRQANLFGE
jgi:hypothetical protein